MNPTFEPIIGAGFDQLAAQRQFWAGHNNRVDESNLNRLAQAEQAQNDYLKQVAQLRDQAIQRDAAEQRSQEADARRAYETGLNQQNITRQLNISEAENKGRVEAENRRTASNETIAAANDRRMQLKDDASIENMGQHIAFNYRTAQKASDEADAAAETAQQAHDDAQSELESLKEKNAATLAKGDTMEPSDAARYKYLKDNLKPMENAAKIAARTQKSASNALERLMNTAGANHMEIDADTGTVTHTPTKKSWKFPDITKLATPAVATPSFQNPFTAPQQYDVMNPSTERYPTTGNSIGVPNSWQLGPVADETQPIAQPATFKAGRFVVTPQ